jgi:hypothetical protein
MVHDYTGTPRTNSQGAVRPRPVAGVIQVERRVRGLLKQQLPAVGQRRQPQQLALQLGGPARPLV